MTGEAEGRGNSPLCRECGAPLDDEHNLRSGAVCLTLEPLVVRTVVLRDPGLPTARLFLMSDGTLRWEDGV